MKKTVVVIGHPNRKESRANIQWYESLKGSGVEFLVLSEGYSVEESQKVLAAAERVVFQFPFHWYSMPGLMKSWLDEVFVHGFAYGSKGVALQGTECVLAITMGVDLKEYHSEGQVSYVVKHLLAPILNTFRVSGMDITERFIRGNLFASTDAEVAQTAQDYKAFVVAKG